MRVLGRDQHSLIPHRRELFHRGLDVGKGQHVLVACVFQPNRHGRHELMPMERFFGAVREDGHMGGGKLERFFSDADLERFRHSDFGNIPQMNTPVIFITGAGKGIGEACVRQLIARALKDVKFRPKLFLTSRTKEDLDRLVSEARIARLDCGVLAADLADAPTAAFEACLQKFGQVDVCLHSAGVGRFDDFLALTREDLEFVMKTNVEASFLLMQAVYRQMRKQKSGLIEWITSVAAEVPFEQSAVYCMSKYAQRGLIEVMRMYARKDNIRLIEIKPGAAYTPMWGAIPQEMIDRMMTAGDVAQPMIDAIFLPSRTVIEEITIRPVGGDL